MGSFDWHGTCIVLTIKASLIIGAYCIVLLVGMTPTLDIDDCCCGGFCQERNACTGCPDIERCPGRLLGAGQDAPETPD